MAGQTICRQTSVAGLRYMTKSVYDDTTGTLFFTPPAKGFLAMLFGPDATLISIKGFNSISRQEPIFLCIQKPEAVERLIQELRQKKGLPDIKAGNNRHQPIQTLVHADFNPMTKKRHVSALLKARVLLFSQQAVAIWVVLLILPVFFFISVNMLLSCNWTSILELIGFNNSAGLKTSPHGPEQFFGAPFHLIWALGVLSLLPIGLAFVFGQLTNRWQSIELLKYGERALGQRLPNERVLLLVNGRPSLCERNYEFSVNGNIYQVKSITSANQPRAKAVTVLFDRQNPDRALVLDDLPGIPIISADDMIVGYNK
jgi:hypothetical protein